MDEITTLSKREQRRLKKEARLNPEDTDNTKKEALVITILSIGLAVAFIVSLGIGRYPVSIKDILIILKDFFFGTSDYEGNIQSVTVVTLIRLPRLMMCVLVGAGLSAGGAAFQGLFRNPMVSPDILGVTTGASVGACIAMLLGFSTITIQLLSFGFGIAAVLLVVGLASALGKGNPKVLMMILAGMVIGSLFNSVNAIIKYLALDTENKLAEITFWLMGSFSKSVSYQNVKILLVTFLLGGIPLLLTRWRINVLAFGEEEAAAMGVDTKKLQYLIIACSTLMTSSSVSMVGNIGWVGLTLPHITRLMVGPNYKVLMPTTMLSGALFMVIVDDIARTITASEIPIGVLTSLIGAPIFIFLMFRGKRAWV